MKIKDNYYSYRLNRWTMKNNMPETRYITGIRLLEYVENPEGTKNQPTTYFRVSVGFATGLGTCSHMGLAYHKEMIYNPLTGNLSYPKGGGLHGHYANRKEAIEAVQIMTDVFIRRHEEEQARIADRQKHAFEEVKPLFEALREDKSLLQVDPRNKILGLNERERRIYGRAVVFRGSKSELLILEDEDTLVTGYVGGERICGPSFYTLDEAVAYCKQQVPGLEINLKRINVQENSDE